jgi:hypothetical protein
MTMRTPGLGVVPTPPPGRDPAGADVLWDESTRPHGPEPGKNALYTEAGRAEARSLVEVHGQFRHELARLREHVAQATADASKTGSARSALNALALRQKTMALRGHCRMYCDLLTSHHLGEDHVHFPRLNQGDPRLTPVIDRLHYEHEVIAEAISELDRALVALATGRRDGHDGAADAQLAIGQLTVMLLSHFSYEEQELTEPIARLALS